MMPSTGTTSPFIPQQDHKGISSTIDGLYIETSFKASALLRYLCTRVGRINEPYLEFYERFIALYLMTSKHQEMMPFRELAGRIAAWSEPSTLISDKKCLAGMRLFDEWQEALFKTGLLSVRK